MRFRAQVPGVCAVGEQGRRSQMCSRKEGAGDLEGTGPATHASLGRAQHGRGGGEVATLSAGLGGVLRDGANA
jgi:hypothetical protein